MSTHALGRDLCGRIDWWARKIEFRARVDEFERAAQDMIQMMKWDIWERAEYNGLSDDDHDYDSGWDSDAFIKKYELY